MVFLFPIEKCCLTTVEEVFVTSTSFPFHIVQSLYSLVLIECGSYSIIKYLLDQWIQISMVTDYISFQCWHVIIHWAYGKILALSNLVGRD